MSRKPFAQYLEVLTSLGVIVSLVVLIVEVRANTGAIERQILMDRSARLSEPFLSGEELFSAYELVKAQDGWEPLNASFMDHYSMGPRQAIAWVRYLIWIWNGVEADFNYGGPSEELAAQVRELLSYADNQLYWRSASHSPAFNAYVQRLMAEPD